MTDDEREAVTAERFQQWAYRMREQKAAPLFAIGTTEAGAAVVCVPRGLPMNVLIGMTEQFLNLIKGAEGK